MNTRIAIFLQACLFVADCIRNALSLLYRTFPDGDLSCLNHNFVHGDLFLQHGNADYFILTNRSIREASISYRTMLNKYFLMVDGNINALWLFNDLFVKLYLSTLDVLLVNSQAFCTQVERVILIRNFIRTCCSCVHICNRLSASLLLGILVIRPIVLQNICGFPLTTVSSHRDNGTTSLIFILVVPATIFRDSQVNKILKQRVSNRASLMQCEPQLIASEPCILECP